MKSFQSFSKELCGFIFEVFVEQNLIVTLLVNMMVLNEKLQKCIEKHTDAFFLLSYCICKNDFEKQ
jgi:hypothetical protein